RPDPDPVRVLRPRGNLAAPEHHPPGTAELQFVVPDRWCAPDDVRRPSQPVQAGGDRSQGILRSQGVQDRDPPQRPPGRSPFVRETNPAIRRAVGGCKELSVGGTRTYQAHREPEGGRPMSEAKPRRLGRGLEALLGPAAREPVEDTSALRELPVTAISPNPFQPRREFDETALAELTASIEASGLLQPIVVRPVGSRYELIAGERRWRAVQRLGWKTVPAVVREVDDQAALTLALIENLQRDDLSPIDTAIGYQQLMTEFGISQNE